MLTSVSKVTATGSGNSKRDLDRLVFLPILGCEVRLKSGEVIFSNQEQNEIELVI